MPTHTWGIHMEIKIENKPMIKNILIYLGLILLVSGGVFVQEISSLDEVWVFNFGRCIANRTITI